MVIKVRPMNPPNKLCQMTNAFKEHESGHLLYLDAVFLFGLVKIYKNK
jgi:hypothetical protein